MAQDSELAAGAAADDMESWRVDEEINSDHDLAVMVGLNGMGAGGSGDGADADFHDEDDVEDHDDEATLKTRLASNSSNSNDNRNNDDASSINTRHSRPASNFFPFGGYGTRPKALCTMSLSGVFLVVVTAFVSVCFTLLYCQQVSHSHNRDGMSSSHSWCPSTSYPTVVRINERGEVNGDGDENGGYNGNDRDNPNDKYNPKDKYNNEDKNNKDFGEFIPPSVDTDIDKFVPPPGEKDHEFSEDEIFSNATWSLDGENKEDSNGESAKEPGGEENQKEEAAQEDETAKEQNEKDEMEDLIRASLPQPPEWIFTMSQAELNAAYPLEDLSSFQDVHDDFVLLLRDGNIDDLVTPAFWHIPRTAGSDVKQILVGCHHLIISTAAGVQDGHINDEEIAVVYPTIHKPGQLRSPYLNVDTTTKDGVARAIAMGFPDKTDMVDVAVVRFLHEANGLFSGDSDGLIFTFFRHPVERAASMFFFLRVADWEPTYQPEFKDWTLEDYAESTLIEHNWMTRMLSRQMSGPITEEHFHLALATLRRKFLVGLYNRFDESLSRFERFFGWRYHVRPTHQEACRKRLVHEEVVKTNITEDAYSSDHQKYPTPKDAVWEKIAQQNVYDLQLYSYAEKLFEEQAKYFHNIPENYRLVDATCCECDPPTLPADLPEFQCPKKVYD